MRKKTKHARGKAKPIQTFSKKYLEHCRRMTPEQIIQFLEEFRVIHTGQAQSEKLKLISIKIPPSLLDPFKTQCELRGTRYQTQIKKLMADWLKGR